MLKTVVFCFALPLFMFTGVDSAFAQEDVEGSEDHPMISRYEGSYITDYEQFAYDRQELVTGMEDEEFEWTAFEGEVTRIRYTAPVYGLPQGHGPNTGENSSMEGYTAAWKCIRISSDLKYEP